MAEQNAISLGTGNPGLHEELLDIIRGPAAELLAAAIMDEVRRRIGGQTIYVHRHDPAVYTQKIATRDDAVRAAFNGRNRREVCAQFGIKRSTFYRITGKRSKG